MKELDRESESRIFATFQTDIAEGQLLCPSTEAGCFEATIQLIDRLPKIPLGGCPRIETVARETHFESDFSII